MGKSQKIEDAAKKDQEFEAFLTQRQNELQPKVDGYRKGFEESVTKFYENTTSEYITIAEGEKWEYHLSSEVGLDTLRKRVTEMVYTVFGVDTGNQTGKTDVDKTENGSITMDLSDSVVTVLKLISGYKALAAVAACNFVLEALDLFGTKLEISDTHNYSAQSLVPGLTLHMDSYANSYSNEKFLHADNIVTTYVRFQLIYSYSLAQTITDLQCITDLQASILQQSAKLTAMKAELVNKIFTMTPDTQAEVQFEQMKVSMIDDMLKQDKAELKEYINDHPSLKQAPEQANVLKATRAVPDGAQMLEIKRMQMLSSLLQD